MTHLLITVDEAVAHLRLDLATDGGSPPAITDPRYSDLLQKMAAAESHVIDYLKYSETGWSPSTVPAHIKHACLLVLSSMWEFRDNAEAAMLGGIVDDSPAANLLRRSRDPAYA